MRAEGRIRRGGSKNRQEGDRDKRLVIWNDVYKHVCEFPKKEIWKRKTLYLDSERAWKTLS